ncbi:hypothetical protein ABZ897_32960 [Nonomuraea sp. NPDC046802]|uniref:hypothetical protein n=1 Tax=Nonomuraea sp. NPDC046802 TaxID=3154919 RepID=UPI0033FD5A21
MRRLVFGDESRFSAFIGAYLGVLTLPNAFGLDGELLIHVGVGRTAGMYGARHLGDARALFLFRSERELDYRHRDVPRQKELLRDAFGGCDRWLDELDRTPAFYFDSITQLRMDTWSPQARVAVAHRRRPRLPPHGQAQRRAETGTTYNRYTSGDHTQSPLPRPPRRTDDS